MASTVSSLVLSGRLSIDMFVIRSVHRELRLCVGLVVRTSVYHAGMLTVNYLSTSLWSHFDVLVRRWCVPVALQ